jgi:hypothetical protein
MAYTRIKPRNFPYSLAVNTSGKAVVTTDDVFNFDYNTDFTIMAWAHSSRNNGQLIKRRTGKGYVLQMSTIYGEAVWDFFLNNGANSNYFATKSFRGWSLGCGVFRSGARELWMNGVLNRTVAYGTSSFAAPGEQLQTHVFGVYPYKGGPVRIYARALTPTEIADYYYYGTEPATTNLLLSYDLTEGVNPTLTDLSGGGYHGTISGTVTWDAADTPMKLRSQTSGRVQATNRTQIT